MRSAKVCLLIHPDGRREFVSKKERPSRKSEFQLYMKEVNGIHPKIRTGHVAGDYVLLYFGSTNLDAPVNPLDPKEGRECLCGNGPLHEFHGIVGIVKFEYGYQANYRDGDFERSDPMVDDSDEELPDPEDLRIMLFGK